MQTSTSQSYISHRISGFALKRKPALLLPNNIFISKNFEGDGNGSQSFPDHGSNPIKENENKGVRSKEVRWAERANFGSRA